MSTIKAQILTFREAFMLTQKGKEYKEKAEEQQMIEMVEVDGKWVKKVVIIFEEYENEFHERIKRDFENYIWSCNYRRNKQ